MWDYNNLLPPSPQAARIMPKFLFRKYNFVAALDGWAGVSRGDLGWFGVIWGG